ncbi:MAG: DUF485 domain-containing protein [Firmicutes bacterium]|uniref:Uncharacterized membrane protein, DUF485 family n=1 Tax=Melghirimyces thermohalophilus TaxID=1236220 RepID=A0A1G6N2K7_9BACL|nr:DUF485 domain-containing protein [Melghirimyces thermohalophilus]MDA8353032.1 DUF485 domain-containing protein [Bacillota bacterium]SDC61466.1 Uncharacterized membrane protein, DUF485 family [Melghirimyces thermohalophilus]
MVDYKAIAKSDEFRQFKKSKNRFIWPIVFLFILYYLALPLIAGYAKSLMGKLVLGNITFGYLYGLTYYVVVWVLAFVYVTKANRFDRQADSLLQKYSRRKGA